MLKLNICPKIYLILMQIVVTFYLTKVKNVLPRCGYTYDDFLLSQGLHLLSIEHLACKAQNKLMQRFLQFLSFYSILYIQCRKS